MFLIAAKKYKILVYTGDKKGAGTDANVSIQLFGSVADSGIKMLDARFKNDFERNKLVLLFLKMFSVLIMHSCFLAIYLIMKFLWTLII